MFRSLFLYFRSILFHNRNISNDIIHCLFLTGRNIAVDHAVPKAKFQQKTVTKLEPKVEVKEDPDAPVFTVPDDGSILPAKKKGKSEKIDLSLVKEEKESVCGDETGDHFANFWPSKAKKGM